jgi:hypothetical protein
VLKDYHKLVVNKYRSLLGDHSPHAHSTNSCQWTDWVLVSLAFLVLWNRAMVAKSSERPFGSLLTDFNKVLDVGTAYLSSRTGEKLSREIRFPSVGVILRLSCNVCLSPEGAEGLCLICHVTGKMVIDPAFLGSVGAGAGAGTKTPQPALTAHARLWIDSVAGQAAPPRGKIAAYVAAHPGRAAHEKAPVVVKAAKAVRSDLTSESFGALLAAKQQFIGVSGLKGRPPVRPVAASAGGAAY